MRATKEIVETPRAGGEDLQLIAVREALPEAPSSAGLHLPPGWTLSSSGLGHGNATVFRVPVLLAARLQRDEGREFP